MFMFLIITQWYFGISPNDHDAQVTWPTLISSALSVTLSLCQGLSGSKGTILKHV